MSNIESLLSAILTRDAEYIVVPQSRVEELLLAIYNSGGGGGGGEGGVDEFARAELRKKVDKREGYALISTDEIERLAGVENYDDAAIRGLIDKKVTAKNGFSLISDDDYANFKNLENYDDTAIKALIDAKVDDTVTVAGIKITTNITASQLADALNLSNYVEKDGNKVLSTNDFTDAYKNKIDANTTNIANVNETLASKANSDDVYTKSETYTKTQTDDAITNKVAEIVAEAPEDFDTLKEMSDWISDHEESAAAMNTAIQSKITAPQTATVGQVLAVKAVSADGKPTEWEVVDQSGGGSEDDSLYIGLPLYFPWGGYGVNIKYNGKIYSFGGSHGIYGVFDGERVYYVKGEAPDVYLYDCAVVECKNELHFLGGSRHFKFDGTTWVTLENLPYSYSKSGGRVVVYNDEIHILGFNYNDTKHYKWNGSSWVGDAVLPKTINYGGAVSYNGFIYIFCVMSTSSTDGYYRFDGSIWVKIALTSSTTFPKIYQTTVLDNKIIVSVSGGQWEWDDTDLKFVQWTMNKQTSSIYLLTKYDDDYFAVGDDVYNNVGASRILKLFIDETGYSCWVAIRKNEKIKL